MSRLQILSFSGPAAPLVLDDAASSSLANSYVVGNPYVRALYAISLDASFGFSSTTRFNLPHGRRGSIVHVQCDATSSPGVIPNVVASDALLLPAPTIGVNIYKNGSHSTTGSAEGLPILQIAPGCNMPLDLRLDAGVAGLSAVGVSFYGPQALEAGGNFSKDLSALSGDADVPFWQINVNLLVRWDEAG